MIVYGHNLETSRRCGTSELCRDEAKQRGILEHINANDPLDTETALEEFSTKY